MYTSRLIQKELLNIIANKVRKHIRTEVGDSYFCVMVDESRDESKREQMAIVLRFLDTNWILIERLQISLVAASREVIPVHQFFEKLTSLINVICASRRVLSEKVVETVRLLELDEIETSKGLNQVETLNKGGNTHWGSHFSSICSLLSMFNATRVVLKAIIDDGSCSLQRGDADSAYCYTKSFEFVSILHL
ncbi:uncharacterized protein [Rutidosis leptorrhynchoides]|uniref:uncharacterized protein n=1 Tax=Rutidosis leptorrhynchoides TaxID=125765 RepID=UPI003A9933DF